MILAPACWEQDRPLRKPFHDGPGVHQPGLPVARQAARMVPAELPVHGDCRGWIPKLLFNSCGAP